MKKLTIKKMTEIDSVFFRDFQDFTAIFSDGDKYIFRAKGRCNDDGEFTGDVALEVLECWSEAGEMLEIDDEKWDMIYEKLKR